MTEIGGNDEIGGNPTPTHKTDRKEIKQWIPC
ncbi:hypothetical protein M789_11830 [Neisseria gonorrhoeae MU_NG23]|nr:hypothetical protein M789_11830 [Neisseria gonorrhoeae MU_NG23]